MYRSRHAVYKTKQLQKLKFPVVLATALSLYAHVPLRFNAADWNEVILSEIFLHIVYLSPRAPAWYP